jgi:DNA-directed RNA polymerase specialized sigma24 family protein
MSNDLERVQTAISELRNSAYFTALGIVRNGDDAEDVASVVMLRCYRSAHRFDVERWRNDLKKGLFYFVKRAAERASIDFIRKRNRERKRNVSLSEFSENENGEHRARVSEPSYTPGEFAVVCLLASLPADFVQSVDDMRIDFNERWWGVDRKTRQAFRPRLAQTLTQLELDWGEREDVER